MPTSKEPPKRILGDLRIFQSVFNDLNMRHEIVTLEDGTKRYAYVYDGVDPYALEDSAFPMTTQLIHAREEALKQDLLFDLDEIDNKPWRVFRQLAEIMPEYADEYNRYKVFYSFGGGHKVRKLIEEFEKSDDYKEYVAAVAKTQLKENKEE